MWLGNKMATHWTQRPSGPSLLAKIPKTSSLDSERVKGWKGAVVQRMYFYILVPHPQTCVMIDCLLLKGKEAVQQFHRLRSSTIHDHCNWPDNHMMIYDNYLLTVNCWLIIHLHCRSFMSYPSLPVITRHYPSYPLLNTLLLYLESWWMIVCQHRHMDGVDTFVFGRFSPLSLNHLSFFLPFTHFRSWNMMNRLVRLRRSTSSWSFDLRLFALVMETHG